MTPLLIENMLTVTKNEDSFDKMVRMTRNCRRGVTNPEEKSTDFDVVEMPNLKPISSRRRTLNSSTFIT